MRPWPAPSYPKSRAHKVFRLLWWVQKEDSSIHPVDQAVERHNGHRSGWLVYLLLPGEANRKR